MKVLIVIFLLLVGVFVFTELVGFYDRTANHAGSPEPSVPVGHPPGTTGETLPGLPAYLETSLAQAQQQGLEELGKWLKTWSKHVQDPRLAWIELDYIVLLNLKDHRAARERFQEVKHRVPPGSPVYDRLHKLEPAYEQ